jgi:hypothetical protein
VLFPEGWSRSIASEFAPTDRKGLDSGQYAAVPQSKPVFSRRRPSWKTIAAQLGNTRPAAQLCDRFNKVIRPMLHTAAAAAMTAQSPRASFPSIHSPSSSLEPSSSSPAATTQQGDGGHGWTVAPPCSLVWTPERVSRHIKIVLLHVSYASYLQDFIRLLCMSMYWFRICS